MKRNNSWLKVYAMISFVFALALLSSQQIFGLDAFSISEMQGFAVANLVPATLGDPQIMKRWSQKYFQRVQSKSIFDEGWTGTTFVQDGPKPSDLVRSAPIVLVTDLTNRAGNVVTHTLIEPMFQDSESRLNYARLKGQLREGTEKSLGRKFIKMPIASAFWGIKEEDVTIGKQETGMANLASIMTKGLSDNVSAYMDDDAIESFFLGYSRHLFTTIAEINDVADGSAVLGSGDLGVYDTIREHPNTYAWTATGLVKAASNSAQDISTAFDAITSAATPSGAMLNSIALAVKVNKIPGVVLTGGKFKAGKTMVRVIVDPLMMNELRNSVDYKEAVNSAYQAKGDEHPLIAQGDILWGPLWISEEEKLLDDAFSNKYSFDADGYSNGTLDHSDPATIGVVGTAGTVTRVVTLDKGLRYYRGTDTAGIGVSGANKIGNIIVMGANSLARTPGPVKKLIPRTTDDYKRIVGLGSEHIFGHKRLDFVDATGAFSFNQSSLRIMAYRGDTSNL